MLDIDVVILAISERLYFTPPRGLCPICIYICTFNFFSVDDRDNGTDTHQSELFWKKKRTFLLEEAMSCLSSKKRPIPLIVIIEEEQQNHLCMHSMELHVGYYWNRDEHGTCTIEIPRP